MATPAVTPAPSAPAPTNPPRENNDYNFLRVIGKVCIVFFGMMSILLSYLFLDPISATLISLLIIGAGAGLFFAGSSSGLSTNHIYHRTHSWDYPSSPVYHHTYQQHHYVPVTAPSFFPPPVVRGVPSVTTSIPSPHISVASPIIQPIPGGRGAAVVTSGVPSVGLQPIPGGRRAAVFTHPVPPPYTGGHHAIPGRR